MTTVRAEVKLDHKSGPVVITIAAQDAKVAAYMANRLKEVFGGKKPADPYADLRNMFGLNP